MEKILKICLAVLASSIFFIGCLDYGKEKTYNGVQLYYTSSITEAEADLLGDYFIKSEFADGEKKTIQLNKSGNTYEVRMVVKKGIEQDQEYCDMAKILAAEISKEVFEGSQVDIHFCDEFLKTLKVMPMARN